MKVVYNLKILAELKEASRWELLAAPTKSRALGRN
jgi:hypothetical protein